MTNMNTILTWKKGIFANTYNIYSDGKLIGKMKNNCFSQSDDGELNGMKYTFKTKGFFKHHTQIHDNQTNNIIGEITYNNWMTKATISIQNKKTYWKYENIWNTRWSIFNSEGIQINYSGSSTSGKIESNAEDDLLLLSGLFVTNYYWQMSIAILIVVFVPIWTTILN
jgi:hypothetical protein